MTADKAAGQADRLDGCIATRGDCQGISESIGKPNSALLAVKEVEATVTDMPASRRAVSLRRINVCDGAGKRLTTAVSDGRFWATAPLSERD